MILVYYRTLNQRCRRATNMPHSVMTNPNFGRRHLIKIAGNRAKNSKITAFAQNTQKTLNSGPNFNVDWLKLLNLDIWNQPRYENSDSTERPGLVKIGDGKYSVCIAHYQDARWTKFGRLCWRLFGFVKIMIICLQFYSDIFSPKRWGFKIS